VRSYWDLGERERAALTRNDVDALLPAERMALGLRPLAPVPPEPVKPPCPERAWYAIDGGYGCLGFDTLDAAVAVIRSGAVQIGRDYSSRIDVEHARPLTEASIKIVKAPTRADAEACGAGLARYQAEREAYDKARRAHEEAAKAETAALADVWEDWARCCARGACYRAIEATWREYLSLCEGNAGLASAFLARAYSSEAIATAAEWFGLEIPEPAEIPAARKSVVQQPPAEDIPW